MQGQSFTDNIFRQEVEDDVIFDLDTRFDAEPVGVQPMDPSIGGRGGGPFNLGLNWGQFLKGIKAPKIKGPSGPGTPGMNGPEIQTPEIQTPEIQTPEIKAPEVAVPPIDFPDIEFPEVDTSGAGGDVSESINIATNVLEPIKETAESVVETASEVTEPAREAVTEVAKELGGIVGDTAEAVAEGVSVQKGAGDKFGQISVGDNVAVDFADKISDAYSEATKGSALEGTKAEDVYNIITDPAGFMKEKGAMGALNYLSDMGIDMETARSASAFLSNPEAEFADRTYRQVGELIERNLPLPQGSAQAASAMIKSLVSGGNIEDASKLAAQAVAMEMAFVAANAILPGSGVVMRAVMALGLEDEVASIVKPVTGTLEKAASDPIGTAKFLEPAVDVVGAVGGAVESVGEAISSYRCNLATAAFQTGLIERKDFMVFPKYRIKVQIKEPDGDKLWAGYIALTNNLYDTLISSDKLNKIAYHLITKHWLRFMKHELGIGKYSLRGHIIHKCMTVLSRLAYKRNKESLKHLNIFFKHNSIMGIYRKIIREVESKRAGVI